MYIYKVKNHQPPCLSYICKLLIKQKTHQAQKDKNDLIKEASLVHIQIYNIYIIPHKNKVIQSH